MNDRLEVEFIDVYSPSGGGIINNWVSDIIAGIIPEKDENIRHWMHIRDAINARETLERNNMQGYFVICGRRAWTQDMVLDEIRGLWTRYQNTLSHSHTISSLSELSSPAAVSYSGERRRPDLGPIHQALLDCGTDGWRPSIAMRMGLMECIAHSIEEIGSE
ncbi:MAG: hypothetical protein VYC11_01160 [Candidatus Thermoplasmatota archaeon]|nr:hypothetical protein [Candidatus Thermoplasmatota archaeon]MEC9089957.1 hypothetical protein [Candidatus Thermoplasmatota archaeon]MED5486680.1 hypothetical protein [Candidatus Thermoplasmatota archaeon]